MTNLLSLVFALVLGILYSGCLENESTVQPADVPVADDTTTANPSDDAGFDQSQDQAQADPALPTNDPSSDPAAAFDAEVRAVLVPCTAEPECHLAYIGPGACAPCDIPMLQWACVQQTSAEAVEATRQRLYGIFQCKPCPAPDPPVVCLCNTAGCTPGTQEAPSPPAGCTGEADCLLAYVGTEPCAPCLKNEDTFACVTKAQAAAAAEERLRLHGQVACAPCPVYPTFRAEDEYVCRCDGTTCTKVVDRPNTHPLSANVVHQDAQNRHILRFCDCCCPRLVCEVGEACEVPEEWWECATYEAMQAMAGQTPSDCSDRGCSMERFYRECP